MFGSKDSPLGAAFPPLGQASQRLAVNDIVKPDGPLGYCARIKCRFLGVLVHVGGAVMSIKKENR